MGTEPGGLFAGDDGGKSFHINDGLWNHPSRKTAWSGGGRDHPAIHSIVVDRRDSRRIFIGISCAGVFESKDDGATWHVRNTGLKSYFLPNPEAEVGHDPHFLVQSPSEPEVLWQQNHCGIHRSTDCGLTWQEISQPDGPAKFGFAIAVSEKRSDTAWVVPAISDERRMAVGGGLVVCRTEDAGKSWQEQRRGLPQEASFDVVYRHGLDRSGESLAFGSTTGNVFLSDDGGDSWQCLGHHFPPVYSVRFGD